jgi:hypothetical protein
LQRYTLETSPRVFTLSERLAHPLALVGIEHPKSCEHANGEQVEHEGECASDARARDGLDIFLDCSTNITCKKMVKKMVSITRSKQVLVHVDVCHLLA